MTYEQTDEKIAGLFLCKKTENRKENQKMKLLIFDSS